MAKEKLILIPSKKMDTNKKNSRNENGLVRMSKLARINMGLEDQVEVYPNTKETEKRLNGAMLLSIFRAFSTDLKKLKEEGYSEQDLQRVGFVTTKTFRKITGVAAETKIHNIWITDSINDTVIGADPEFLLFDKQNKIVRANNVLSYHGPIGCDGAMAEVRPKPAIEPEELVENIKTLFTDKVLTDPIKNYNWVAACYHKDSNRDYPVGGHIHIGNPIQIARIDGKLRLNFFKSFNKILDELLAIPMVKIDGTELGRARRTECTMGKFGYFGEFRTCNGRLEHRTLSGMWMMHPKLATLVLGTAKAIIDAVFINVANNKYDTNYMFNEALSGAHIWSSGFNEWEKIPLCKDMNCTKSSKDMIAFLHKSAASRITLPFLKKWYDNMKELPTYNQYALYIDGLYETLKNKTEAFMDYSKCIQHSWIEEKAFLD